MYKFLRRTTRIRVTLLYTRVYAQSSGDFSASAVPASPNYLSNDCSVKSGQRAAFAQLPARSVTAFALSAALTPTQARMVSLPMWRSGTPHQARVSQPATMPPAHRVGPMACRQRRHKVAEAQSTYLPLCLCACVPLCLSPKCTLDHTAGSY